MSTETCNSVVDYIQRLLLSEASNITLISCSTRDVFIEELCEASDQRQASLAGGQDQPRDDQTATSDGRCHWLFSDVIDRISRSERLFLVFCPTVEHLRAYLGCRFRQRKTEDIRFQGQPLLAIVNMVSMHASTAEFSAQSLSRTSALAVEAAAREDVELVLCECRSVHYGDIIEPASRVWDMQIPLLNSVARLAREEQLSNIRTIQVKNVLMKWFRFTIANEEDT